MSFPRVEGYVVTEKLGSGSYSTVYKAYTKVGARSIVAVKCIDKSRIKHSGAAVDNLVTEIRLLKTLTHPHIVHMKEFTWDDRNIYIIMEYCCGGDLSKYIRRYGRVPEKQVLYFLQQLASALKFLREKGVVHMDLKPHNLLLHKNSDGKYLLKVADFGFAQHMSEESKQSVRGSPLYMAPEMIAGKYDARVDLWSVGVIMYECLFGKAPYSSATFKELVDKIERKDPIRIPSNAAVSPGCLDLLTRLLQHDPDKRISYEEFFNHEYLDLEYMPNKENYDKAVSLIKQAIELDGRGELASALDAYAGALRRLVPVVRTEGDALRRHALAAKLHTYMERAEEIKAFLQGNPQGQGIHTIQTIQGCRGDRGAVGDRGDRYQGDRSGQQVVVTSSRGAPCCVQGVDGNSYDFSNRNNICPCKCMSKQASSNGSCACRDQDNGLELEATPDGQVSDTSQSSKDSSTPAAKPRGPIARFLRRAPVPYLHSKDDVPEETKAEKILKNTEDHSNDMCKIT